MRVLVAVVGCAVLGGCVVLAGCEAEPADSAVSRAIAEVVDPAIAEAEAGGAGEAQLAVLRQAKAEGELSIEDARAAARAAVKCVADAGSKADYYEWISDSGLVIPGYNYLGDTPEHEAIGETCSFRENFWVNMVYQVQPSSLEANDAYVEQQAPLVRSCMVREGYSIAPDATTVEILRQALDVKMATDSAVDCLAEAKIGGF